MADLPAPVTTTDQLLLAVHRELVGLRADLTSSQGGEVASSPGEPIELTEPKTTPARTRKRT